MEETNWPICSKSRVWTGGW